MNFRYLYRAYPDPPKSYCTERILHKKSWILSNVCILMCYLIFTRFLNSLSQYVLYEICTGKRPTYSAIFYHLHTEIRFVHISGQFQGNTKNCILPSLSVQNGIIRVYRGIIRVYKGII